MNLLAKTKQICRSLNFKPERAKGQNFLIDENVYETIIAAADLKPDDRILEVGPGLGFLTARLAAASRQVTAVELDGRLADYLAVAAKAKKISNLEIIKGDILRANLEDFKAEPYKIVANLPYNITSIFLRQFLGGARKPESLVLLLQKEVAERIVARPPEMSLLAVSVQYYGRPEIVAGVPAAAFWPRPAVASAVIKIETFSSGTEREDEKEEKSFFRVVKIGFSARRKMLKNNLAAGLKITPARAESALEKSGLNPQARAQDLNLQDWRKLFVALKDFVV